MEQDYIYSIIHTYESELKKVKKEILIYIVLEYKPKNYVWKQCKRMVLVYGMSKNKHMKYVYKQ